MAIISVPSSATGNAYSVRIAGDTPTAEEQARIDAYVAQMDARMAPVAPPQEPAGPDTSFTGALRFAFDQPLENMAVTSRALGGEGIASFLSGLTEAPVGYQPATEGFVNEGGSFFDFSYLPRAAVEQTGQVVGAVGTRAAGALLGGAAGSVIPGVGTAAGAVAGGFAGPALFEAVQVLGPVALERAKNNGREEPNAEDWLGAASTAAGSGALNAIAPGMSGFFKKTIVEAGTEGLQSLIQQAGGTAATDVGLQLDPRQAAAEAILGGTAAGAVTAPFAIAESRAAKREEGRKAVEAAIKDLEEDQKEEAEAASKQLKFAEVTPEAPVEETTVTEEALLLPAPSVSAPTAAVAQESLVTPEESLVTPEAPRPELPFRWRDYTAAVQAVAGSGDASVPNIQKASSPDPKAKTTPAVAKAIRDRMAADGVIVADKKAKGGYRVVPDAAPIVDPTESYRRTLDDLQKDVASASLAREKALQDARRAEQTGTKADARKFMLQADAAQKAIDTAETTRQEVQSRLPSAAASAVAPRVEQPGSLIAEGKAAVPITEAPQAIQTVAVSNRTKRLKQSLDYYQREASAKATQVRQLQAAGKKVQLPKSDIDKIARLEQEAAAAVRQAAAIRKQLTRPAQDIEESRAQVAAAKAKEASVAAEMAARTPIYTAKEGQLFTALRRRLDNLGLSDVKLVADRVLRPQNAPKNALIEGMMDVDRRNGNRIISLALGVYDPNMSQQELFDAISGVMNHEVIHALRSLGLFTDGEWKTLSELAARQRYMKLKDGKPVERNYTYLQRAQGMYASSDPEVQVEEAVAEMFRDYVAGTLKVGGKPKTLLDRIKGFFKALWGSHAEAGITDPNLIFEGVRFGDIGRRDRKMASPEGQPEDQRYSAIPLKPNERRLTVLDRYENGRFRDDRPRNAKGVAVSTRGKEDAMVILQRERGNKVFETNEANKKIIARLMAAEAEAALGSDRTAIGWYDAKLRAAKSVLELLHPEIGTDPGANAAMDYATAVTSNGMAVTDNYRAANEQYENWKKTGRFMVRGYGKQGNSMEKAFSFYNKLRDRGMSDTDIATYLSQDTTVAELRKNDILREIGIEIDSKEFAAAKVKVSYVMGPKIGQGFYQNLRGNFDPLTMDRWWMRMFNRLTGDPFVVVTDETLKSNSDRVLRAERSPASDYEREVIEQAKLNRDIDMVTEGNALEFAKEVERIYQKAYRDAEVDQRPEKTELFLAAGRYALNASPQLEESPRGPGDRQYMRDVTNLARKYLKDATGIDITPADLQALMWYAEKRLWDSLGIRKGQGEDNDYVDGAIALLRNKGYTDDAILQALPAGERFRIDPVGYPAGQDGPVRGPDAEGDTVQAATRLSAVPLGAAGAGAGRGDGRGGRTVRGTPALEGSPVVQGASGPDQNLVLVAEKYARENGIDLRRQGKYVEVDEGLAGRIAKAFDDMEHDPQDPKVREAYAELIRQTRAQYDALADAGYKFWFIDGDNPGEYASSPWNAMRDLRKNKSMGVFPTVSGFGTREEVDVSQNPLLEETDLTWPYGSPDGPRVPVLANDLFRAVHDAFGHGIEGSGFRARGEENAWQAHIRLFTGLAKGALTTETRGQNSWLNYGPFGEQNRNAKTEDTIFADQKVGLMPEWTWTEGLAPDGEAYKTDQRLSIRFAVSPITPAMQKKIQANQQSLMYASSADALAGLISKTRLVDREQAKKFTDGVLRRFQDSMLPIGRMVQELSSKGLTITDAMDPYLQENLMHGKVGERIRANKAGLYEPVYKAIKRLNVPKGRVDQLASLSNTAAGGRGYVALSLEAGDSPNLVLANAYLYAAHARERNRYIKANKNRDSDTGSGMSDAEAAVILQWFSNLDPANRSAIDALEKGIRLIVADTNQTRVDGGLISSTVVDPYNFYVPLRGLLDQDNPTKEDDTPGYLATPGLGARGREDRRTTGRYDYATDIVANVFAQNSNAIVRAERNKVGQSLLELLRSDPSMTNAYAEVLPYAPKKKESRGGRMVEVPDPKAYDEPDILVVKEDGKETFVRFADTTMAGAMNGKNGLSVDTGRGLIGAMAKINRYLATINTSYNPEFIITNMVRDLTTAGVQINQFEMEGLTADALRGVPSAIKGIARSIRSNDDSSEWSKVYRDFVNAGGQNSTNQMNSIGDYMDDINSMLGGISDAGIRGKWSSVKNGFVGKGVGSVLNFLEDYNTVVENGIRVATYKALIDRGVSRDRAAQAARNVTVNFAKRGDYGQLMGAFYLFYNASIQGSFALLNAAARSKKVQKILLGVAVSGFVMDAINGILSGEDEDGERIYDKIPDHVLEHNLVIMDFLGTSDRGYITIPLPYGINLPFNTGRALSRYARDGYTAGEAGRSFLSTLLDVINPLGGTESFLNFAFPTVLDPIIDVAENEDFANKPIYKEGLPFDRTPSPASQMYWSTTSPSAVWIADNLNSLTGGNEVRSGLVDMSPDIIQFWFEFVTGGIGRFAMNSAEVPFTVVEEGVTAENIRNIPFVKKVIGSVSEREDMTSYIEGAKQILTAGEELKRARESGDGAWAKQTIGRYSKELRLVGPIKSIDSGLREVSKMRNAIEANTAMPEDQKKILLERLEQRKQMLLARGNKLIKDAGL